VISQAPPLALYVHLPWCVRKCPYCDFNSHAVPSAGVPERAYLDALLDDLEHAARSCAGRPLVSVFFGGGTPSLFSASAIAAVLDAAQRRFPSAAGVEVTLEANPGTIERGRFRDYRDAGVNRVSLGAQSFDARQLQGLGRIHGPGDTLAAVEELHAAGLDNFNLDLMYALPRQTVGESLADLERALELGPAHVSHYQLTLEPGTVFERRPPPLPDDDTAYAMQLACESRLAEAGFRQYEVSAYGRPGRESRHNLNYWRFGDYVGIGAGAHGKVSDPASGRIVREARVRHPAHYLAATRPEERIAERREVPAEDLPFEFCLNALRLVDGFEPAWFEAATGLPWSALEPTVAEAERRGLLATTEQGLRVPTTLGRRFLNDLQALFLAPKAAAADVSRRAGLASGPAIS